MVRKNNASQGEIIGKAPNHFTFKANFPRGRGCRRKSARARKAPPAPPAIPRVARLLALAHYLETQVRSGTVKDYAELASLLGVTRARITQLLNLLLLAPDIQEEILFLPPTEKARAPLAEHNLRRLATEPDWARQRERWVQCKQGGGRFIILPRGCRHG